MYNYATPITCCQVHGLSVVGRLELYTKCTAVGARLIVACTAIYTTKMAKYGNILKFASRSVIGVRLSHASHMLTGSWSIFGRKTGVVHQVYSGTGSVNCYLHSDCSIRVLEAICKFKQLYALDDTQNDLFHLD